MNENTNEILTMVADKVKNSNETVKNRVIDTMVEAKLVVRAAILETALNKAKSMEKELKKLGEDVEHYTAEKDAKPIKMFSKKRKEERDKHIQAMDKLDKMIEMVLSGKTDKGEDITDDHWNKLNEAAKQASQNQDKSENKTEDK